MVFILYESLLLANPDLSKILDISDESNKTDWYTMYREPEKADYNYLFLSNKNISREFFNT